MVPRAGDVPPWIPDLPWLIRLAWGCQNLHGRWYYRRAKRRGELRIP
ncbi:MAG: hypothetical protein ACUVSI_05190 [Actinomycetota bacterium]